MVDNKVKFYEEIKFIKPFSGDIDELHQFLACCINAKNSLGFPEKPENEDQEKAEERFIKAITAKLDVDTFEKINFANPKNIAEFRQNLYEIFHIIKDPAQIYCEITSVEQMEFETVVDYFDKIETLIQSYKIACEFDENSFNKTEFMVKQLNKQIIKSSIHGLRSNIRIYCKCRTFNSFNELKEFCIHEERLEIETNNLNDIDNREDCMENEANDLKVFYDREECLENEANNSNENLARTSFDNSDNFQGNENYPKENDWENFELQGEQADGQDDGNVNFQRQRVRDSFAENDYYFTKQEDFRDMVPYDSQRQGFAKYLDGPREGRDLNGTDFQENEEKFEVNADNNLRDGLIDGGYRIAEPNKKDKSRFGRENDGEDDYQLKYV